LLALVSDDEVDNSRLTPIYAISEKSDRRSSSRPSGSINLAQNLSSAVDSLSQALGSFSGGGLGSSSSGHDYFINRIEQLERQLDQKEQKLERQNELIAQQKDIICELKIKLAHAGVSF
jgi:cell shape-determining protein MreC